MSAAIEIGRTLSHLAGRTIVVKIGGAALDDGTAQDGFARALALVVRAGARVVVVHGGGPALSRTLDRLGIASRFVDGHRVTSPEAAEVAEMVLSGTANRAVAAALSRAGVRAVGLAGGDAGGVLEVEPYRPCGVDLGRVGRVRSVRAASLDALLDAGFVPVLSSTARGRDGEPWNVNADVVAGEVARAVAADLALFLSDVPGVRGRDGACLRSLTVDDTARLIEDGVADGGMRPKLEAAAAAVLGGVACAVLADGRAPERWLGALAGADVPHTRIEARSLPARGVA